MPFSLNRTEYVNRLIDVSLQGLPAMFDEQAGMFCYRRKRVSDSLLVNEGLSLRYTLITLLGLHRAEATGQAIPFDLRAIISPLLDDLSGFDNLGDIGLLLWFVAQSMPEQCADFVRKLELDTIVDRFPDGRKRKTMELSWLLTGLSYAALSSPETGNLVALSSPAVYELIKGNYGGSGIFAHAASSSFLECFRNRMGSFADQVYPAYAFALYSRAFGIAEARDTALACCRKLCALQGPLGQWWWHYDASSGKGVGRYPVYSVHQEGMAPMTLFEVGSLTGTDFSEHLYRGLQWNSGANELGADMVDWSRNIIWRCIDRPEIARRIEEGCGLAGIPNRPGSCGDLKILYEGRPYCLGWLLYAFSDTMNEKRDRR
jgi:hypothetical protein